MPIVNNVTRLLDSRKIKYTAYELPPEKLGALETAGLLDVEPASKGRWALMRRFPIGPILGISPFNFPLNLVCHIVAPALASGNTIILKPASQTPLSALRLAQSIEKAEWPAGSLNVIPADSEDAHLLLEDHRIKMVTFTPPLKRFGSRGIRLQFNVRWKPRSIWRWTLGLTLRTLTPIWDRSTIPGS